MLVVGEDLQTARGALHGVRVVEFEGIGPAPFGVMLLADMGADVLRISRPDRPWPDVPIVTRGRHSLTLDLKRDEDVRTAETAIAHADVLVEGFRPGVMERFGLGPQLIQRHPRLIYARSTGWGQTGLLAQRAGHDINYLAVSGMLAALRPSSERPVAPINLLGDYGGGGLYLALGILLALFERERSGRGQIVDAAIVDGCASMLAPILGMRAAKLLPEDIGAGMLSGNASFYRTYQCADGRYVAVGALEPEFRALLTDRLGLARGALDGDQAQATSRLEEMFASRDRDEWVTLFADVDACVTPVLTIEESVAHAHQERRANYTYKDGRIEPGVAPRLSRTPGGHQVEGRGLDLLQKWTEGRDWPAGKDKDGTKWQERLGGEDD